MNADELLFKLGELPQDTTLTVKDLIAVIEALKPVKSENPKQVRKDTGRDTILSQEEVAEWIGESTYTLEKWRSAGGGPDFIKKPKNIGYSASAVKKWLDSKTVSSTAEFKTKIRKLDGFMFAGSMPYMLFGETPVEFFKALSYEEEASGFLLVSNEYYDLPQNNLSAWIGDQLSKTPLSALLAQIEEFVQLGGDLNQIAALLIGDDIQTYTAAHSLAMYDGNDPTYSELVTMCLAQGMRTDIANNEGKVAMDVMTNDLFRQAVNSFNLYGKLSDLPVKPEIATPKRDGGKL